MLAITTVFFAAVADGACPLGGTLLDVSADEAHAVQYAGTCFEGGALRHEILNKPDCEAAAQALTGGTQTVTQETNTANPSKCYYDTTDCVLSTECMKVAVVLSFSMCMSADVSLQHWCDHTWCWQRDQAEALRSKCAPH